jgi:hypothetical protein
VRFAGPTLIFASHEPCYRKGRRISVRNVQASAAAVELFFIDFLDTDKASTPRGGILIKNDFDVARSQERSQSP